MKQAALPRLLLALATFFACALASAQGLGVARESAVKAAFLYKFGSFVEFPAGTFRAPTDPFVIGVFGNESVADELEQITRGRVVGTHPVRVQRVRDAADLAGIHMLFAGGSRESRVRDLLSAVRGPVLTVTDIGRVEAVLHFAEEEGRVRFHASLTAAAARRVRLSAKLLEVASYVEGR